MQLLKIQSIPIEYQFRMERPRLEMRDAATIPEMDASFQPAKINLHSKNIQVQIDTTDMRRSMGLMNTGDMLSQEASKGMQTSVEVIGDLSRTGTEIGKLPAQEGMSIAKLISQKIMQEQLPETITAFLPSVGPTISWDPAKLDKQYEAGSTQTDWELNKSVLDYFPGKFEIIIEQYPHVKIEYLGEPNYVPPSSDPNYEENS